MINKIKRNGSIHLERKFQLFKGFYYICEMYHQNGDIWARGFYAHKNIFTAYRKALKELKCDIEEKEESLARQTIRQMDLSGTIMTINNEDYKLTKVA